MSKTLTGGCACGAVRYVAHGEPKFAFHCQCRDCQHMTGSGHATEFVYDADFFEISGELAWWNRETDSGNTVAKAFCPTCGSPIYGHTTRAASNLMILAGSLDDPAALKPARIFFPEDAQPWDHIEIPQEEV